MTGVHDLPLRLYSLVKGLHVNSNVMCAKIQIIQASKEGNQGNFPRNSDAHEQQQKK